MFPPCFGVHCLLSCARTGRGCAHAAQDITLQKGGVGREMSPGEDSTRWAQGAGDGGWQLWSHSRCLSQPGSAGVSVTSLETVEELKLFSGWLAWRRVGVSQVVLVALQHLWGSAGGIEEWIGMS